MFSAVRSSASFVIWWHHWSKARAYDLARRARAPCFIGLGESQLEMMGTNFLNLRVGHSTAEVSGLIQSQH